MSEAIEKKGKQDKKFIQSVQRAGDILNLFIHEKRPLGITEFSKKLSLPKTTIQGIVLTLLDMNYLERDPATGKYRLGPMLFQLGMKYATNMDLVNTARVWMERLCYQFREPVNLGMLVGNRVVVLLRVEPENRFMTMPQAGSVIPAHTTCIGKVIYAHLEDKKREELLKDYFFEPMTDASIVVKEDFMKELEKVRRDGISFDNQESIIGLAGIGAPIFNWQGQVFAAFAITGNAEHISSRREEIINAVRYTSSMISGQLGYNSGT
ncbi:MAG: hypothetical protein CVV44_02385 [Spirochaetae bacterium HGW-Spirochaetae-1]|jgi:DNA-binding IclR family transcriptional regulator|nr:MAG: hypothetical protein CVV44_02385 [Spirochaetae bacterium HGW-Spirochaetae-1]